MFCEDFRLFRGGAGIWTVKILLLYLYNNLKQSDYGNNESVTTHVGAKGACHFQAELKGNRLLSFIGICVKGEGHCICEMSFGDIVELRDALNIAIGWDERSSDIPGKTKNVLCHGRK